MRTRVIVVLLLLLFALLTLAQNSARHSIRIICANPKVKIVKMVRPVYPAHLKQKEFSGTVVVRVDVSEKGEPTTLKVLKGVPELSQITLDALRQWRWDPLKLNGQPLEFETTVTVNFEPR